MTAPTGKPFGDFDLDGMTRKLTQITEKQEHERRMKFLTDKAKADKAAKEAQERGER
jgi:hypothetical protein